MHYFKFNVIDDNIVVELNLTYKKDGIVETIESLIFPQKDIDSIQERLPIKFDFDENIMQVNNIDELLELMFGEEVI